MDLEKLAGIQTALRIGLGGYGTASKISDRYQERSNQRKARLKTTIKKIKLKNTVNKMQRRRQIMAKIKAPTFPS
jgi:hypothetical protein